MIVNERRILGSSHPMPFGGKWAEAEWQLSGFKHDAASVNGILNPALL